MTPPQQQELLQHERFIAEVERIRAGPSAPRRNWLEILKSPVVSTLITVLGGGIIVYGYQARQKANAVAQEQYQVFVQKQRDVVDHSLDLIADGQLDSAGLLDLTQPQFDQRGARGKIPPDLQKWREEILSAHESYRREWGIGKFKTAVALDYYFLGASAVANDWRQLAGSLDALEKCSWDQYDTAHRSGSIKIPVSQLCNSEQAALRQAINQFTQSLNQARHYAWQRFSTTDSAP